MRIILNVNQHFSLSPFHFLFSFHRFEFLLEIGLQARKTNIFLLASFALFALRCAVAACSVVPVNLAYGFSFPFYLNKLSYLKSPPVQAHASGAATAIAAFFLLSFVLFFCRSNRNELWTRVRVFVFIYRDASSARLSILMSIIWTIYK